MSFVERVETPGPPAILCSRDDWTSLPQVLDHDLRRPGPAGRTGWK